MVYKMKKIIMLLFLLFSLVSCSMVVSDSNEKVETEEILNNEIPDISKIEFNDLTVTYDGNPHSIFVENLPIGLTVSYEGNGKTIVGVYQVKAIIKYSSGETLASLTATLTIVENTKTDIVTPTNSYTITFDNMGHGINPDALIDLEEIPNNLPELEDDLYEFFGWYLNEDLTDLAVGGTKLNANITLYAKWDEKNNDLVEKFNIVDPIFETRKIYNISDVTMDDFFNLGNRIEVKITVSDEELSKLQTDYETGHKSDIYRLASKVVIKLTNYNNTFTWEFENVGIRQKGNTSRKSIYNGDGSLNLNHYKLSFDETFDDPERYDSKFINKYGNEEYKDREFLGMSGLDFKWNKNEDSTHIREIYASYMYRASGILSQHIGLSTLSIIESNKSNKETSMGLCTVFEPASKSFIKRSLKSDDSYVNMSDWSEEKLGEYGLEGKSYGDLYKCIYGADLTNNSLYNGSIGVGNISGSYVPLYDRKTHKDDEYDDAVLKAAINAISSGDYDRISQYVDLEYLAISEAVGFVVGNPDSMRYNDNNFMIYMRRTDGKMVFIPIDNDRCFGITKDWNPKDANMNLSMLDRKDSTGDNTIKLLLDTVLAKTSNPTQELYVLNVS